ncbi:serine hydrolase [Paenibacillus sp. J5C2022]|uniref:serine hydrolase n=1 Tax=Paenibacillus sp. J5C2022 TaxID=2977129 RepID=UPI0021CF350A|nr:serine hydrolase [Paenibacillus sp. J5C2022]
MTIAAYFTKQSRLAKTMAAGLLSLSLLAPAVHASSEEVAAKPKPTVLNAETASAFLDEFFDSDVAKPHYVGASVVIVKDGEVVAQKGYGYADKEAEIEADPAESVFRMASVSKTFNAVAAMQLVEQGKIGLHDDISPYLNGITYDNPFDTPVTVEHLLTHTTGFRIQDPTPEDIHFDLDKRVEIEDYVRQHMPTVEREPGSSYMYDNFASMLLGLIVQNVSEMPYESYMQEYVFEPLQMNSSSFELQADQVGTLAEEYDASGSPIGVYAVTPTVMPQGGMLSTAEDIGKFMLAFLNGGAAGDQRILTRETVEMMEEYRSSIHPLLPNTTYGFEAPYQLPGAGSSSSVITKAGDLIGTSTYMFLIPEQNTGVFVAYNKTGALRNLLYTQFMTKFFPAYAEPAELGDFKPQSGEELAAFEGYYSDLRMKSIVSVLDVQGEQGLVVSDAIIGPRPLKQVDRNLFVDSLTNQFTAFQMDEDGEVAYMKEPYLNPLGYAGKGAKAEGYRDVAQDSPYAEPIHMLQSLGYYANDGDASFYPENGATRAQFVEHILKISGLKGSKTTELAFSDLEGHPSAAYVQLAYESGMVKGTTSGTFAPDRTITRQEAAVILWRALSLKYPANLFDEVSLSGEVDEWAKQAVQMMVGLGIIGPEVRIGDEGATDFLAKEQLTREQEAAILFKLLTQQTDQIVASLTAEQNTEAAPEADVQDEEVEAEAGENTEAGEAAGTDEESANAA